MRKLSLILTLLVSYSVYGQEFLHDNAYRYGCGIGKTIEEADNRAFAALSEVICSSVSANTTLTLKEENRAVSERFEKDVRVVSNLDVTDSHQYVDESYHKRGCVKVYRYINKDEYVAKRASDYKSYMRQAEDYLSNSASSHRINLALGCYYYAYKALDTDIMDAYNANNDDLKEGVKEKASRLYCGEKPYLICTDKGYGLEINACQGFKAYLYGFEYKDSDGVWKSPKAFYRTKGNVSAENDWSVDENYVRCFVGGIGCSTPYRISYEVVDINNHFSKINTPDDWYFDKGLSLESPKSIRQFFN